jgi:predicted O-linked N-acetylglucosamine transferase (SPINDLY family)
VTTAQRVPEIFAQAFQCHQLGRLDDAERLYRQVLEFNADHAHALQLLGLIAHQLGQYQQAIDWITKAIAVDGRDPSSHSNLGAVYYALQRFEDAVDAYHTALRLKPDFAQAQYNLGAALKDLGRIEEAASAYEAAARLNRDYAEAYFEWGNVSYLLGQLDRAIDAYNGAVRVRPDFAEAYANLGIALHGQSQLDQAVLALEAALRLKPDYPQALVNLGTTQSERGYDREAVRAFTAALIFDPAFSRAFSGLIFALDSRCDISVSAHQKLRRHWSYLQQGSGLQQAISAPDWRTRIDFIPGRRLRIGYVSGDFKHHSVSHVFGPIIREHNRQQFEIICYSNSPSRDARTAWFESLASAWRDIAAYSDDQLAAQIIEDRIDILVDLSGHTAGNRLTVFCRKPAPVQITAWGNTTGTGISAIDAFLADPIIVPNEERADYAEAIIDLPCVLMGEGTIEKPPLCDPPALTRGFVTFGSLNRIAKIGSDTLQVWARVLHAVPGSQLLIKNAGLSDEKIYQRILGMLRDLGITPDRLDLRGKSTILDHIRTTQDIDVMLDTLSSNGGVTTIEAMWLGVPSISLMGTSPSSRTGASLNRCAGLDEFVAKDLDDYVAIAARVSADLDKLCLLRRQLPQIMARSPLGNAALYTSEVEAIYHRLWQDACQANRR